MSRLASLRKKCPDNIKERILKAQQLQFFVLQELGPMAFVLSDNGSSKRPAAQLVLPDAIDNDGVHTTDSGLQTDISCPIKTENALSLQVPDSSVTFKKFKVALGFSQKCSCSQHMLGNDLCVHILWVMLKIFHIDPDCDMIYQTSLTEREISEMLQNRKNFISLRQTSIKTIKDKKMACSDGASEAFSNLSLKPKELEPRPIEPHDVCAICQEELLSPATPLAHCRFSCGNSIHVKCMKILMDHQTKALGMEKMECPLCRGNFGLIEDLKAIFCSTNDKFGIRNRHRAGKDSSSYIHHGSCCKECSISPISGNLHLCTMCSDVQLCDKCFKTGAHSQHAFKHKASKISKLFQSERVVAPILPSNIVASLEQRELVEEDYEILLILDKPQQQGSIPLHIINSFPLIQIKGPKDKERVRLGEGTDGMCGVCQVKIGYGELVRQISCGHGFHQPCIDRWLLHQRTVCPKCGLAAYYNVSKSEERLDEMSLKPDTSAPIYKSALYGANATNSLKPTRKYLSGTKKCSRGLLSMNTNNRMTVLRDSEHSVGDSDLNLMILGSNTTHSDNNSVRSVSIHQLVPKANTKISFKTQTISAKMDIRQTKANTGDTAKIQPLLSITNATPTFIVERHAKIELDQPSISKPVIRKAPKLSEGSFLANLQSLSVNGSLYGYAQAAEPLYPKHSNSSASQSIANPGLPSSPGQRILGPTRRNIRTFEMPRLTNLDVHAQSLHLIPK
ncbi:hypothetical protein BDV3_001186 [Batrachochytrium dendrobatidis]